MWLYAVLWLGYYCDLSQRVKNSSKFWTIPCERQNTRRTSASSRSELRGASCEDWKSAFKPVFKNTYSRVEIRTENGLQVWHPKFPVGGSVPVIFISLVVSHHWRGKRVCCSSWLDTSSSVFIPIMRQQLYANGYDTMISDSLLIHQSTN
jgi:hypothetical protein